MWQWHDFVQMQVYGAAKYGKHSARMRPIAISQASRPVEIHAHTLSPITSCPSSPTVRSPSSAVFQHPISRMPLGKINSSLSGNSYGAGAINVSHATQQSGAATNAASLQYGKGVGGQSTYGDGAVGIESAKNVPKVADKNLEYGKGVGGTSGLGGDAMAVQTAVNAPKAKSEGLGQVDKKL